jgi:hypothetical protein
MQPAFNYRDDLNLYSYIPPGQIIKIPVLAKQINDKYPYNHKRRLVYIKACDTGHGRDANGTDSVASKLAQATTSFTLAPTGNISPGSPPTDKSYPYGPNIPGDTLADPFFDRFVMFGPNGLPALDSFGNPIQFTSPLNWQDVLTQFNNASQQNPNQQKTGP